MDLVVVITFLALYYLRPQEWPIGLSSVHFVQITMLAGLASLFVRARGFRPRDLFRTPHDWAVLAFWLWIVLSSPTSWPTFKDSVSLYIFYAVIVQTLYSVPRMSKFIRWWSFLVPAVAALALLSLYGFDPLESAYITNGSMNGRLVLNLSIFNNPNALGHTVVPAIPLLYYFCVWKKPVILRAIGVALIVMAAYCIFRTQSKGAFIACAATIVATITFGRPKSVQIAIVSAVVMFGAPLLYALPRMGELSKSKTDEAIQGRVMAFKHGFKMLTTTDHGVGFQNWGESFFAGKYRFKQTKKPKVVEYAKDKFKVVQPPPMPIVVKAAHSSYVQIGAELGYPGFFLFFGVLCCCLRTLVTARTSTPEEERIRRSLFCLIISYMISSWMVDFAYRPTFFMFAAATAALHRHLLRLHQEKDPEPGEATEIPLQPLVPAWRARLVPQPALTAALAQTGNSAAVMTLEPIPAEAPEPAPAAKPLPGIRFAWNRIGLVDIALTLAMTYAAVRYWSYLLTHM